MFWHNFYTNRHKQIQLIQRHSQNYPKTYELIGIFKTDLKLSQLGLDQNDGEGLHYKGSSACTRRLLSTRIQNLLSSKGNLQNFTTVRLDTAFPEEGAQKRNQPLKELPNGALVSFGRA